LEDLRQHASREDPGHLTAHDLLYVRVAAEEAPDRLLAAKQTDDLLLKPGLCERDVRRIGPERQLQAARADHIPRSGIAQTERSACVERASRLDCDSIPF